MWVGHFYKNKIKGTPILKLAIVKTSSKKVRQKKFNKNSSTKIRQQKFINKNSSTKIRQQKFVKKFVKKIRKKIRYRLYRVYHIELVQTKWL